MTTTDPTALDLLKRTEALLSALHGSVARHDNLAANLGCAGCELRDQISAALPSLAAVPAAVPPTTRTADVDRVAEALTPFFANFSDWESARINAGEAAIAIMPVLLDQAAGLREAADFVRGLLLTRTLVTTVSLEAELRRLADEAQQQPDTETLTARHAPGTAILCPDCRAKGHSVCLADEEATPREVVHGCPPDGSGLTLCCGRTPFELPLGDRISSEAPVTCPGAVVSQPGKEA